MPGKSITITFPDGRTKAYPAGITGLAIARELSTQLAKRVLAIAVDGATWEASRPLMEDSHVRLLTWEDQAGKEAFWHSTAHLLAEALEVLYPGVQLAIGPPIARGFYYDVDLGGHTLRAEELPAIAEKMKQLACQAQTFERVPISHQEAVAYYQAHGNRYKLDLLAGLEGEPITFYKSGQLTDLCRGGHLPHTGLIKAIELLSIAGAYWQGDEQAPQLTRIYGISFPKQKELDNYLTLRQQAAQRDHRKLGKSLGWFTFSQQVGIGLPLWLPQGTYVREALTGFLRKAQEEEGYLPVVTPHIGHRSLYVTSGHYEKYGQDSFQPIPTRREGEAFLLKPMNCPHHCVIYKSSPRSYRDLPLRLAEFGTVYRYEQHGELHGLTRTRGFTQDDAHIFCTHEQVQEELEKVLRLVRYVLGCFDFQAYTAQISIRDPQKVDHYIGDPSTWAAAEEALQQAAQSAGLPARLVPGEAAFYGPKVDFMVRDALDRSWQLGTVQLDYHLPERFGLHYIGADNQHHRPVMIHRAPFGSLERFMALLLEHTGGCLPFWLQPKQVAVLPIAAPCLPYAHRVSARLKAIGVRAWVDTRPEKIGRKIREAEMKKIPMMAVVGAKEEEQEHIALRRQGQGGEEGSYPLERFLALCKEANQPPQRQEGRP